MLTLDSSAFLDLNLVVTLVLQWSRTEVKHPFDQRQGQGCYSTTSRPLTGSKKDAILFKICWFCQTRTFFNTEKLSITWLPRLKNRSKNHCMPRFTALDESNAFAQACQAIFSLWFYRRLSQRCKWLKTLEKPTKKKIIFSGKILTIMCSTSNGLTLFLHKYLNNLCLDHSPTL